MTSTGTSTVRVSRRRTECFFPSTPRTASSSLSSSSRSSLSSLAREATVLPPKCITIPHVLIREIFSYLPPGDLRWAAMVNSQFYYNPQIIKIFASALGISHHPRLTHAEINASLGSIISEASRYLAFRRASGFAPTNPASRLPIAHRDSLTEYLRLHTYTKETFTLVPAHSKGWNPKTLFGRLFYLGISNEQIRALQTRGLDITIEYREMLHFAFTHGTLEQFTFLLTYLNLIGDPSTIRLEEALPSVHNKREVLAKIEELRKHESLMAPFLQNGLAQVWNIPMLTEAEIEVADEADLEVGREYSRVNVDVQNKLIELSAPVTQQALIRLMHLEQIPIEVFERMCVLFMKHSCLDAAFLIASLRGTSQTVDGDYFGYMKFLITQMKCPVNQEVMYQACQGNIVGTGMFKDFLITDCKLRFDSHCLLLSLIHSQSIYRSWVNLDELHPTVAMLDAFLIDMRTTHPIAFGSPEMPSSELESWFQRHKLTTSITPLLVNTRGYPYEIFIVEAYVKKLASFGLPLTQATSELLSMVWPFFKGIPDLLAPAHVSNDRATIYVDHLLEALKLSPSAFDLEAHEMPAEMHEIPVKNFNHFIQSHKLILSMKDINRLMKEPAVRDVSFLQHY